MHNFEDGQKTDEHIVCNVPRESINIANVIVVVAHFLFLHFPIVTFGPSYSSAAFSDPAFSTPPY